MDAQDRIKAASPLAKQAVALMLDKLCAQVEEELEAAERKRRIGEIREHLEDQLAVLVDLEEVLIGRQTLLGVE